MRQKQFKIVYLNINIFMGGILFQANTKRVNFTHKEITDYDELSILLTCAVAGYPRDITLQRVIDGAILKVKTPANCTSLVTLDYFLYPTCADMTRYRCLVNYRDGQTGNASLELSHPACKISQHFNTISVELFLLTCLFI